MQRTSRFELTSRALITRGNKVLLCRARGSDYYFLPGGHVEFREIAARALHREFREEFGTALVGLRYIGACENIFKEHGTWHHELIIAFTARVKKIITKSLEAHLEPHWIDGRLLSRTDIRPHAVRDACARWMRDRRTFWTTERPGSRP